MPVVVARLACANVNMPNYDGFPVHKAGSKTTFEVAVYEFPRPEPHIMVLKLLYSYSYPTTASLFQTSSPSKHCRSLLTLGFKDQRDRE